MEMVGAIFRDKYAEKDAQDGRTTYHIAIMPLHGEEDGGRAPLNSFTTAALTSTWCSPRTRSLT